MTIVPRGQSLGLTYASPTEDRHNYTKEYLLGRLTVAQGGRVAEELIFGPDKVTTGAAQDFAQATELARRMVMHFGMTDALGPLGIAERIPLLSLGMEIPRQAEISEQTAALADREIRRLLEEAQARARALLGANLGTLHTIADELLEHETLDRPTLQRILARQPGPTPAASPGAAPSGV